MRPREIRSTHAAIAELTPPLEAIVRLKGMLN